MPPPTPNITITSLRFDENEVTSFGNEIEVPRDINVVGKCSNVQSNYSIWLCVVPIDSFKYYPQREPIQPDDHWEFHHVGIGRSDPADSGRQFIICAVLADEVASSVLYQYAQEVFTGMETLPTGATICDQILVRRSR